MGLLVTAGANLWCSFGVAPATLNVLPTHQVMGGAPVANIMDFAPFVNVPPFGMCITQSNPAVASATAAASGVPTPAPCTPVIAAPWVPGCPKLLVRNFPAVDNTCTMMCAFGGAITVMTPGPFTRIAV